VPADPWWIADVQAEPVGDVDRRDALIVDEHAVEAAVVDGHPAALIEAQHQMRSGDQRVGDADVGAKVASDDHVIAWGESAGRPVVLDGQRGRGGSRHRV